MGRRDIWSPDNFHYLGTRRTLNAKQLKAKVIKASRELLAEVGPRAFTVKGAAQRAKVGRTSVYKHFGHKAGLLAACREEFARLGSRNLKWSASAARSRSRQRKGRLRPTLEVVKQAMLALVEHLQAESDLFLLAAAEGVRGPYRPISRPIEQPWAPIPNRFLHTVRELLQEAQKAGELHPSLEPHRAAACLNALWWQELSICGPRPDGQGTERDRIADMLDWVLASFSTAA
jgi:AcrR family transcriptional regulator